MTKSRTIDRFGSLQRRVFARRIGLHQFVEGLFQPAGTARAGRGPPEAIRSRFRSIASSLSSPALCKTSTTSLSTSHGRGQSLLDHVSVDDGEDVLESLDETVVVPPHFRHQFWINDRPVQFVDRARLEV